MFGNNLYFFYSFWGKIAALLVGNYELQEPFGGDSSFISLCSSMSKTVQNICILRSPPGSMMNVSQIKCLDHDHHFVGSGNKDGGLNFEGHCHHDHGAVGVKKMVWLVSGLSYFEWADGRELKPDKMGLFFTFTLTLFCRQILIGSSTSKQLKLKNFNLNPAKTKTETTTRKKNES